MEGCIARFRNLWRSGNRRLATVIALIFVVLFAIQTFTLPSRSAYSTQFTSSKLPEALNRSLPNKDIFFQSQRVAKLSLLSDSHDLSISEMDEELQNDDADVVNWLDDDENPDEGTIMKKDGVSDKGFTFVADAENEGNPHLAVEHTGIIDNESMSMQRTVSKKSIENATSLSQQGKQALSDDETFFSSESLLTKFNGSASNVVSSKKKNKLVMPLFTMPEMDTLLLKNRASRSSMRPRWSSALDKEILAAKKQIENAPLVEKDGQLLAPLYRNFSKFKRSYELMEKTLKIYIYQEGEKPIFHQPFLRGIYASEGWFMKLLESNKHYLVKDPSQAHLFYIPFSSRLLQFALYAPSTHNRTNLRQHLKNYVDKISSKYPFWNRTGGANHFFAACHDWALYVTKNVMDRCIRALCVADLSLGFELGKDVSLPETNVISPKNPLKDLGGKPWNERPILVFFAGNLHGTLRSILLKQWENKDPDMKIFRPSTFRVARSKMKYSQYMKRSKYCICPRGYEVNSPRLVESIFFECVPVILSDNFVPPFFEILNWDKFSVILPEKDVPRLKEILASITELQYKELQMGVKMVQQHFLWHTKPVKYDLFHMILHSIWMNRVYNIKVR